MTMSAGNRIRGLIGAVTAAGLAAVAIGLQPVLADSAPQMTVPSLSGQVKASGASTVVVANAAVGAVKPAVSIAVDAGGTPIGSAASRPQVNVSASVNTGVAGLPSATVNAGTNSGVLLQTGASALPPISAAVQAETSSPSVGVSFGSGPTPEQVAAGAQAGPSTAPGDVVSALAADPSPTSGGDPAASVGADGHASDQVGVAAKQDPLADPNEPVVCPLLVFRPLVAGCQSILGPITGRGLAATGWPILTTLLGLLLILIGIATYLRSRGAPIPRLQ